MTSIGAYAFNGCSKLASVTIPSSVTRIGEWAFAHSGLKRAVFLRDVPELCVDKLFGADKVFCGVPSDFEVNYFDGKAGFTSPKWRGYPSVKMGAA